MNGYIKKSPTKSGLHKKISRDGMPVTDVMKDGSLDGLLNIAPGLGSLGSVAALFGSTAHLF